jgi:hypothetical protein
VNCAREQEHREDHEMKTSNLPRMWAPTLLRDGTTELFWGSSSLISHSREQPARIFAFVSRIY